MAKKPSLHEQAELQPIDFQIYKRYLPSAFDESLSILEKMNKMIHKLNDLGELTNDMIDKWNKVIKWVIGDGLEEAVGDQLNRWLEDGTLEKIINEELFESLNDEIGNLCEKIKHLDLSLYINIRDRGASTDDDDVTDIINDALKEAQESATLKGVLIPKGTFRASGIKMRSNVELIGSSHDSRILRKEGADAQENIIAPIRTKGDKVKNYNIRNLTVKWNRDWGDEVESTVTDSVSNCVSIVNSENVLVQDVHATNALKHNFDIGSYTYRAGEGNYPSHESQFVWVDRCYGYGSGDDNFTTHNVQYLWITNCDSREPDGMMGNTGQGNTNPYEIDEGSRHVWVHNCYAYRGAKGIEIKGHKESSAANHITVTNCTVEESTRAFDIRHIGFQDDEFSTTARYVTIDNCVIINPRDTGIYPHTVYGMHITAYRHVNISNITFIGGKDDVTNRVMSIQQNARNININNINFNGFKKAEVDLNISGSSTYADYINISNVTINDSADTGIDVGGTLKHLNLTNITMLDTTDNRSYGLWTKNAKPNVWGLRVDGYKTKTHISGQNTNIANSRMKEPFVQGNSGVVRDKNGAILASSGHPTVRGKGSAAIATSAGSNVRGDVSTVMASSNSSTSSEAKRAVTLASRGFVNEVRNTVAGGNGDGQTASNRTWSIHSSTGRIFLSGKVHAGHSFSDFGEYFESVNGEAIPTGTLVSLNGDQVEPANGKDILGAVSETTAFAGSDAPFFWQGRFLRNDFGGIQYKEGSYTDYNDDGEPYEETGMIPVENPDFDPEKEYVPRSERDEWNTVGLVGKVFIRVDDTVESGDFIDAKDGIGTKGETVKVMKITSNYDDEKGYGVALAIFK